ncbi:hypothetical protein LTR09_002365 [Extremus antarcticus]|uniref:Uncharacterized protein n=1 Tax=Extremus antarcticus TaxID=702011 RepID=A0AAJ0LV57_9PEZI|nr:hypothetical protein LTR09_002365 [Extremus antarcticus]
MATHTAPADATELVNLNTQPIQSSAFLRLPAELRFIICEQAELLQSQGKMWCDWGAWSVNECTEVTRAQHHGIGVGALSQSCGLVYKETFDVLYDNSTMFIITISTSLRRLDKLKGGMPTYANIDFLRHVKHARVDFRLYYHDLHYHDLCDVESAAPPSAAAELRTLESIISTLRENASLHTFSFDPNAGSLDAPSSRFKRVVCELRRQHTRDGVKAGKGMKDRELDFAKAYVDMLKDLLYNHHGGDELKFYRSFGPSPPRFESSMYSFESLTHYFR